MITQSLYPAPPPPFYFFQGRQGLTEIDPNILHPITDTLKFVLWEVLKIKQDLMFLSPFEEFQ